MEVTKTIIIEKYDDGSSATRTETRTVRKPVNAPTDANGKAIQYLNPDLTPENSQAPKVSNTTDPAFIKGCLEVPYKFTLELELPNAILQFCFSTGA